MAIWLRYLWFYFCRSKVAKYNHPKLINIGNLSVGGTGKTPMVIYLATHLSSHKTVAILSKGYQRTSKGFKVVDHLDDPLSVGDEAILYYQKLHTQCNVMIAVASNRTKAIAEIMHCNPQIEVIIIDDGFQDLSFIPSVNILLTTFQEPFFNDQLLPLGLLREPKKAAKRADFIIFTKILQKVCNLQVDLLKRRVARSLSVLYSPEIFFTTILYKSPVTMWGYTLAELPICLLLVTGIARPVYLKEYLEQQGHQVEHLIFGDHHWFSQKDIQRIAQRFKQIRAMQKVIVMTEKDSVRFMNNPWRSYVASFPVVYIPIEVGFLQEKESGFLNQISKKLSKYK